MLRALPQTEQEGESDYERWLFETQRAEWAAEQQQEEGDIMGSCRSYNYRFGSPLY